MRIPPGRLAGGISEDERELRPMPILAVAGDTAAVTRYLRDLVDRCAGPVPLVDELAADELGTPRATAAIARAALSVLRSKDPAVIRADLERELAEADRLAVWRTRQAWAEYETAWRSFRHGREHLVSFAAIERRRGREHAR